MGCFVNAGTAIPINLFRDVAVLQRFVCFLLHDSRTGMIICLGNQQKTNCDN